MSEKTLHRIYLEYIDDRGDNIILELSCTDLVEVNRNGQLTKSVIADGSTISDHFIVNNSVVKLSGFISDVKTSKSSSAITGTVTETTPEQYTDRIVALQAASTNFKVYWGNKGGTVDNCFITNINVRRDNKDFFSYKVSLTLEQARFARKGNDVTNIRKSVDGTIVKMSAEDLEMLETGTQAERLAIESKYNFRSISILTAGSTSVQEVSITGVSPSQLVSPGDQMKIFVDGPGRSIEGFNLPDSVVVEEEEEETSSGKFLRFFSGGS